MMTLPTFAGVPFLRPAKDLFCGIIDSNYKGVCVGAEGDNGQYLGMIVIGVVGFLAYKLLTKGKG